jgi:hypothetical protein
MKQSIDNKTIDMWGEAPATKKFLFYIETLSGERVEWAGLTIHKAKQMHSHTAKHEPINLKSFGWRETK